MVLPEERVWVRSALKRSSDVIVSLLVLVGASPLLGLVAALIWLTIGKPILFRQERAGLNGELFTLLKFRTMRDTKDGEGTLLEDDQRITRLGSLLRSWSIDEVPELFNVLRGDMSLVGPRPLLAEYLPLYSSSQARRHEVKPGVTGLAQVKGRNDLSWEEKFELDVWYVDHWSLRLDLRVLVLTAWNVLQRKGISQKGHATMPWFVGFSDPHADVQKVDRPHRTSKV